MKRKVKAAINKYVLFMTIIVYFDSRRMAPLAIYTYFLSYIFSISR